MPLTLSLNTNPLVNRFAEPRDLIHTVARELRIRDLQLTHEFINPSWPAPVIRRLTRQMAAAMAETGVRVTSGMTGPYGRLNHFGHPDPQVRRYYIDWFKTFADIIGDLGGTSVGTQFAIFTYRDFDDPGTAGRVDPHRDRLLGRGGRACQGGGPHLGLLGADEHRARVRRDDPGCAGAAGQADGGRHGRADVDDGRYRPWRRDQQRPGRLSTPMPGRGRCRGVSPIIHIKQSLMDKGGHRPFTAEFNAKGRVQPAPLLAALAEGGAADNEICLELSFKEREPNDRQVIPQIAESVAFWAPHIDTGAADLKI